MQINKKIKELLDKVVTLHLTKGVQPSEIADAIFEKNYTDIGLSKSDELAVMTVSFIEDDDFHPILHTMKYTYTLDQCLIKIEQKIGTGNFKIQWDRFDNFDNLIKDLSLELSKLNHMICVNSFIKSLPDNLHPKVNDKIMLLVA